MATIKIASLPSATSLEGTDYIIVDQDSGTKKAQIDALLTQFNIVTQDILQESTTAQGIGIEAGGSVEDALQFITPEMIRINGNRYLHGVTTDAVPFLQAAIDYGHTVNLPVILSERYPVESFPQTYELPRDDGTVYPGWITAGTDQNIAPEPVVTMRAALRLYNDSAIFGLNMQTTGIKGSWVKTSGPWDNTGTIGFFISGDSGKDGYVRYHLHNLQISGFTIGRLCEGTSAFSTEDDLQVSGCGISGVFQGEDAVSRGFIKLWYNLAGDVFGGQWLTRNHAYSSTYLPPYPATDIHRAGWNDSSYIAKYHYYGDTGMDWTHPAYAAIDNFFATYFFKPANSAKTADGGRTSNSQQPGVWPMGDYRGVAGRALTRYSRYGREILNCNITEAKVMWSPRTPFYHTAQSGSWVGNSKIEALILERVGIIVYSQGNVVGNRFNVDNVDPWDTAQTSFPAMACRGNISCLDVTRGGAVQQSLVNELNPAVVGGQIHRVTRPSGATGGTSLLTLQEYITSSFVSKYVLNSDYMYSQPINFNTTSGARFKYDYGTFTPTLTISGQTITGTDVRGSWYRIGDIIRCHIRIRNSSLTVTQTGGMVIGNLPFTAGTVQEGMSKGSVYTGAATDVTLIPRVDPGTNQCTILRNSAGNTYQHPAGAIDFTLHCDFDYVVPFNTGV